MKLRNKKTGTIYKIEDIDLGNNADGIWIGMSKYNSLAELNEEWEDYEEPKEDSFFKFTPALVDNRVVTFILDKKATRKEAKKLMEKLKAWKRLKDGGFTFKNWTINQTGTIDCFATWGNKIPPSRKNPTLLEDLDLLFGGEE